MPQGERGNSSVGYVALSLVFLREHNRICDELYRLYPRWEDERLFQTARMINICLLLKLTVEEYINHIAGERIFCLDPTFAERQNWYEQTGSPLSLIGCIAGTRWFPKA